MSTISRRIHTALKNIAEKDYENALIQISIAIDATTKKKWPKEKEVGKRISNFVQEYERFIYHIASSGGIIICGSGHISIQGKELPEIMYKSVRCALLHGDELGDTVTIKESFNNLGEENGKIIINTGHIYGLLFSVIVDPINKSEACELNHVICRNGKKIFINEIWGDIYKFLAIWEIKSSPHQSPADSEVLPSAPLPPLLH